MTWSMFSTAKSGKREVAVSLLMFWVFVSSYLFFWIPAEVFAKYQDGYGTLTWAVIGFAAGAFGIDFVMKAKTGALGSDPAPRRRIDNAESHTGAV